MRKPRRTLVVLALCVLLTSFTAVASALETQASTGVTATTAPLAETAIQTAAPQAGLGAPQNFTATSSKSSVKLSWDTVEGAKEYKVYSCATENGKYKLLKTLKGTQLTHKIKLGKKTRYYVVAAVNGKTVGAQSKKLAVSVANATGAIDQEYAKIVKNEYIISGLDQKYLDALNADRAANGLEPVQYRAELAKTAMVKAADMAATMGNGGTFYADHVSPTYGHPFDMGEKYLGYAVSENIMEASNATGWQNTYADAADCGRDQFMNSPTHRALRLNKDQKFVGFAMYYDGARLCICEHYAMK